MNAPTPQPSPADDEIARENPGSGGTEKDSAVSEPGSPAHAAAEPSGGVDDPVVIESDTATCFTDITDPMQDVSMVEGVCTEFPDLIVADELPQNMDNTRTGAVLDQ